jgi:hypothetical protein
VEYRLPEDPPGGIMQEDSPGRIMSAPLRPPSPGNATPDRVLQAVLATDFRAFVEYVFDLLRPGTPFRANWHIDAMAHKVAQVATGEVKRLIITMPPRNLKSDRCFGRFARLVSRP